MRFRVQMPTARRKEREYNIGSWRFKWMSKINIIITTNYGLLLETAICIGMCNIYITLKSKKWYSTLYIYIYIYISFAMHTILFQSQKAASNTFSVSLSSFLLQILVWVYNVVVFWSSWFVHSQNFVNGVISFTCKSY